VPDIEGLHVDPGEPGSDNLGGELRAIVRAKFIWWSMVDKEIGQNVGQLAALEKDS
jgi:hypothetical protein